MRVWLLGIAGVLGACEEGGAVPGAAPSTAGDQPLSAGSSGRYGDYLRSDPYPKLALEIDYVPGFEPSKPNRGALTVGLAALLDKPGGITMPNDTQLTPVGDDHAWTFVELESLAVSSFDLAVDAETITMHLMFVDGHYEEDTETSKVLGLAWSFTHLVMFKATIRELCELQAKKGMPAKLQQRLCDTTELGIWTHEIGHLLGLVDNGLAMVKDHRDADPEHGAHDSDPECIMYWAYQGNGLIDVMRQRLEADENASGLGFGPACLADLIAFRDG